MSDSKPNSEVINSEKQVIPNQSPYNEEQNQQEQVMGDVAPMTNQEEPFVSDLKKKKMKEQKKKNQIYSARRLKHLMRQKPIHKSRLLYQAYFFFMSLAVLSLSILSYRDQQVYEEDYIQLLDNWNSEVIDDIKFTYTNKDCKNAFGTEYTALFQYDWPGTMIGCDCSTNTNLHKINETKFSVDQFFDKYFMKGRVCSTQMKLQNCQTVNEEFSKTFTSWNDGTFGKPFVLCARRQKNINYLSNSTYCEQKQCGSGDTTFCVPANQKCPITEMGFSSNSSAENAEIIDFGRDFYFYFRRNTTVSPISEIRVSEGNGICVRNQQQNISPFRYEYPLINTKRVACEDQDEAFTKQHTINEEQFYLSNNVIYLQSILPYFDIDTKYNWSVYTKNYIQLQPQCKSLLHDIYSTGYSLYEVYVALRVQLGFTIAYFICVGVILNIVGIMTACNFTWSCMMTHPDSQFNVVFLVEIIFKMVMQIAEIIVICISFVVINSKHNLVAEVNEKNCFTDQVTKGFFSKLETDLRAFTWSYNLAILVIFAFTFLLDFFIIKTSISHGSHHGAKHHHNDVETQKKAIEARIKFRKSIRGTMKD